MKTSYDLVILGAGSAAFGATLKAVETGKAKRIAMVERGMIGGTCVNVGCVPSKNMLRAGELKYYPKHQRFKGIGSVDPSLSFEDVIDGKDGIVRLLRESRYRDVLDSLENVDFIEGSASFISSNEVKIGNDKKISGRKFIIATGSLPNIPPFDGIREVEYLTNVEALSPTKKPDSLIIIGGRALGLEFAQMYSHFGTKVTLIQRSKTIIPEEEPEIAERLQNYLVEEGVDIHTGASIKRIGKKGYQKIVTALIDGREKTFEAEELLLATGRRPNTKDLALENAGVRLRKEDGGVKVNSEMKTSSPNIWAAGDVVGEPMLETIAAKEGATASSNALENKHIKIDFLSVPHAVFTSPQVASVGLTEAEAEQRGYKCTCSTLDMKIVPKAVAIEDTRGLVKMVTQNRTGRILGVHILAEIAADMIHEAIFAVKYRLTINDIIDTVHVFPTMTEAIKLVATSFLKDVEKLSCCAE
jgi:mercuric reductase